MSDPTLESEVRAHLQSYLLGSENVRQFHDWFVRATSEVRRTGQADATVLTIELRLAEYKRGDWSEAQLRGRLVDLLPKTLQSPQTVARDWTASAID